MINVNNISFKYAGQKRLVFDDFSIQLEENRIYGLLGKNGTGKSTLLYLLSGLLRPAKGTVSCDGIATYKRQAEMLSDVFLVTEEFEMPAIRLSEYVKLYKPFYPHFSEEILQRCLSDFEMTSDVHLGELSMGQRKKAYISFAMATNTKYLLMDEPTNGLDIPSKSQFRKVIAQHMTDDRTVIISTHQVHDVELLLDHVLILDQRSVLLNASMQDIMDQYTFEYRTPQQMDAEVLYAEPTLQGNAVVAKRKEGDVETQVNLELLFNYKTTQKTGSMQ
jgi:ABC-2 type transport system ATP-binding protein